MITVKGFTVVEAYVNNTPGNVSAVGELSTWSRTYSREKAEYQSSTMTGYKLVVFRAVNDSTLANVTLTSAQSDLVISVGRAVDTYLKTNSAPYDPVDLKNTVLTGISGISNLEVGAIVNNGTNSLPEWYSFSTTTHTFKFWMSDQAFRDQYDHYEIVVVPPITPVTQMDAFFGEYNAVLTRLASATGSALVEWLQAAKQGHPETYVRILNFDFYNRLNSAQKNPTSWGVLVYGKAGDNIDAIKDAITEYVLSKSTSPRANWEQILPDLFKRTEFFMLPMWSRVAVPNLTALSALYSVVQNVKQSVAFAQAALPTLGNTWIYDNLETFPYDYKEVAVLSVPGKGNVTYASSLRQLFPDYLALSSTSTDFMRMNESTRNWSLFMSELLMAAETLTVSSGVPSNLRKQTKDGVLYASAMYANVNYLVAARSNSFYNV